MEHLPTKEQIRAWIAENPTQTSKRDIARAFGIKGAHLWSITGQIAIIGGKPAIGVGATMYFDPTKSPGPPGNPLMTGTSWIKGDMEVQVSYPPTNSCFGFDFNAGDTGSARSGRPISHTRRR